MSWGGQSGVQFALLPGGHLSHFVNGTNTGKKWHWAVCASGRHLQGPCLLYTSTLPKASFLKSGFGSAGTQLLETLGPGRIQARMDQGPTLSVVD
uniref:Uncharacterized protein n=1 Tax=Ornithorhynchus anatinus TaxID=9258 RepID=A0A6I8NKQ7_ORNAN